MQGWRRNDSSCCLSEQAWSSNNGLSEQAWRRRKSRNPKHQEYKFRMTLLTT
jgi:hypothetical protein